MKNFRKYLPFTILIFSIAIGIFFRFYRLGKSPAGVYVDEASIGYNAFSILKTGKDEYGKFLPIMFRSFSTFQSPIYTYITVPFVALFGLSSFSTRLPSALFGVLCILLLYLLAKKLSSSELFAQISALFLAISPWHIQYSRTAYETNIALFFLLLAALCFYNALKKPWLFVLSAISFAVSFSAYRAEILIVPVLLLMFTLCFGKTIVSRFKSRPLPIILSCLLGLIIISPTILILRTPGFQARTSTMNIFLPSQQEAWGNKVNGGGLTNILNNPQLLSIKEFFSLYTSYLSPRYMFSLGDAGPRKPFPDLGTFFVWQFPLYLAGLYFLFRDKGKKDLRYFVFTLLLVSPISAALTRDPYSTLRSLPLVIPQILLISFGLTKILEITWPVLNKQKYLILILLTVYSTARMFISIFYFNDYYTSVYWNYGWQQAIGDVSHLNPNLPIIVDNSHGDSYIELLFLLKYDPATYQRDNFEVPLSEYYTNLTRNTTKHIGRFLVKNFQWGVDTDHVDQYIIADNIAIGAVQIQEHNLTIVNEIKFPGGGVALRILKTNPKK